MEDLRSELLDRITGLRFERLERDEGFSFFPFLETITIERHLFSHGFSEDLDIDKSVAGSDEGLWSFFLTDPIDFFPSFSESRRESREVRVTRDDTESIDFIRVEDIHRIDDERGVARIFPTRVAVLLDRDDRMLEEEIFPLGDLRLCPVSIDTFDRRCSVFGDLFDHCLEGIGGDIFCVDEDSELDVSFHRRYLYRVRVSEYGYITNKITCFPREDSYSS